MKKREKNIDKIFETRIKLQKNQQDLLLYFTQRGKKKVVSRNNRQLRVFFKNNQL
jgi:hypothetical protein